MTTAAFAVCTLAAFRLTRLVVDDTILSPIRDRLHTRWLAALAPPPPEDIDIIAGATVTPSRLAGWLYDLSTCPWCVGFWIAGAVLAVGGLTGALDLFAGDPWMVAARFVGLWFALAAAQSIVYVAVDRLGGADPDPFE